MNSSIFKTIVLAITRSRRWWLSASVGGVAALAAVWWLGRERPMPATLATLPWPASPFRNTVPGVAYVGSDRCVSCHPSHLASLRRTGMGRSMAVVDPTVAPPDAEFDHPVSKRRYTVVRKNGQLWHRETLLVDGKPVAVLNDIPVKYVVGSGRHAQTFLAEIDGFLVESPITWYASRRAWFMSPGYDRAEHAGFQRAISDNCLFCHAGLFDPIAETYHKFAITETSISCERCHGPGALHVERHARGWHEATATDAVDDTIVNPARLPRELAEAVCQQCHLRSSAAVAVRGRSERDFRPGLPLQEFRYDLRFESGAEQFTVTGHVEQLRLSRCYQQSMMTCLTCHEPHDHPRPRRRADHYQRACLACHQPGQCNVAPEIRARQSPANQCVHCHMPQAATEVTHVALTHHRIGKHGLAERPLRTERGELRPVLPWLHADAATRKRSLGLGYLEIAGWLGSGPVGRVVQQQALALLTEMEEACQADPAVAAARLQLEPSLPVEDVIARADRIIAHPGTAARDRGDALWLRADALARIGRFDEAAADLRRLTTMRRKATDWLTLADVYRAAGREIDSIAAFESAVAINPRLWKVQRYLAEHFRRAGDVAKAAFHQARAVP